jgi:hypothetical protein
MYFCY